MSDCYVGSVAGTDAWLAVADASDGDDRFGPFTVVVIPDAASGGNCGPRCQSEGSTTVRAAN